MTHPHTGHSPAASHSSAALSDAELGRLHESDKEAGRNIVVLMTGVFTLGLIGYSIVAYIAAQG
jgi:hypothetical protein